jgi:hypothetical protein
VAEEVCGRRGGVVARKSEVTTARAAPGRAVTEASFESLERVKEAAPKEKEEATQAARGERACFGREWGCGGEGARAPWAAAAVAARAALSERAARSAFGGEADWGSAGSVNVNWGSAGSVNVNWGSRPGGWKRSGRVRVKGGIRSAAGRATCGALYRHQRSSRGSSSTGSGRKLRSVAILSR